MVVFNHCTPTQLIAYPTFPINETVATTVQQGFDVGSFARFGNPTVALTIHNRSDFHDASHYNIRETWDREGLLQQFLVLDTPTAASHATWYVDTTQSSKWATEGYTEAGYPPITYPGEDFTLWQARIFSPDVHIQWASISVGVRSFSDNLQRYAFPFDPHNMQDEPFTLGVNLSRKEDAEMFLRPAYVKATYEEFLWSMSLRCRRHHSPLVPFVTKLKSEVARGAGLLSKWFPALHVPHEGETTSTQAPYDWDSPMWTQNVMGTAERSATVALILNISATAYRERIVQSTGHSRQQNVSIAATSSQRESKPIPPYW